MFLKALMKVSHARAYAFYVITYFTGGCLWRDGAGLLTSFNRFRQYPALITIRMTRNDRVTCCIRRES